MRSTFLTLQAVLVLAPTLLLAKESFPAEKSGIKSLQLVSDQNSIQPGKSISIGLFIQHLPGYHTYWKAPGIVGVPTSIAWELPENFKAAEIEWPVPELTKMAQYTAYGYEKDVCLLSEISVPAEIKEETITLKARVSFMCCSKTCHPGWHDFELIFPVNRSGKADLDLKWQKIFEQNRSLPPVKAPETWKVQANDSRENIRLILSSGDKSFLVNETVYCFCEDNQINSDSPQILEWSEDKKQLTLLLTKSEFGPENLKKFSALLYHPDGWSGTLSKWVTVSVPLSSF